MRPQDGANAVFQLAQSDQDADSLIRSVCKVCFDRMLRRSDRLRGDRGSAILKVVGNIRHASGLWSGDVASQYLGGEECRPAA